MKAGAKCSLPFHPLHPGRYIDTNDWDSIKNIKNRNSPLSPLASHAFPYLGPSWPISALSGDRSASANRAHAVLSRFIVSTTRRPYFSELTHPSPDPVLDVVGAGCGPAPHCSHRRPCSCSRGACYRVHRHSPIAFDSSRHSQIRLSPC